MVKNETQSVNCDSRVRAKVRGKFYTSEVVWMGGGGTDENTKGTGHLELGLAVLEILTRINKTRKECIRGTTQEKRWQE